MTYLQLVNQVLSRLRENQVTALDNPYLYSIGNHVNDAKRIVEDSWRWSQLKTTDEITTIASTATITLPNTADVNVELVDVFNADTNAELHQRSSRWVRQRKATTGQPQYWTVPAGYSSGLRLSLYPIPDDAYTLLVTSYKKQPELLDAADELLVPAQPVYMLAAALAQRERGELAGQPTSEAFSLADRALADAIAYDSALQSEYTDWFYSGDDTRTNVGRF